MKLSIVKGATSALARIFLQDSSSTVGAGLTGLTNASAGLVCYRARDDDGNAAGTAISLSAGTRGTWSSGGFVEKDATNMPGWYEFGIPNAALATGSRSVGIHFKGATNMAPLPIEIELTGWDNQDAVHGGLSALPNTACTGNASLLTSGSGTDQLTVAGGIASSDAKKINAVSTSTVTTVSDHIGTVGASTAQTGDSYARIGAAGASLTAITGVTLAASQHVIVDSGTVTTLTNLPSIPANWLTAAGITAGALNGKGDWLLSSSYTAQTGDAFARLGAPAGASVSADVAALKTEGDAIKSKTDLIGLGTSRSSLGR